MNYDAPSSLRTLIGRWTGSGRESLTHLATSMAGSALVRVNVTHDYGVQKFEQDLKKAVLTAGIDAKHTVFLLKDAQVRHRWKRTCRRWLHTRLGACLLGTTSFSVVCLSLGLEKVRISHPGYVGSQHAYYYCSQILEEAMLEDINCLLGSGEVPNLFTPDEEADIVVRVRDTVRATGTPDTRVSATRR